MVYKATSACLKAAHKIGTYRSLFFSWLAVPVPSVGTINTCENDLGLGKKSPTVTPAWLMTAAHWSTTVTAPHYISDDKSDVRGIKSGWYAIEDDGNRSSEAFPAARNASRESLSRRTG
jgi:hypothetical protein